MCSFQEKMTFLLCPSEGMSPHFKLHGNFPILCQMGLLPNINFLSSKQNRRPKLDPKMLKQ